jgi:hypothetical protein
MKINRQRGIVRTIIIIVIALLVISYFGINLQQVATSPTSESNFSYVWNGVVYVWDTYLKTPATEAYNFFITYIWDPAIADIERIDAGQLPEGEQNQNPAAYPTPPAVR